MDFFQAQDAARGRTRTLVVLFGLAVAAIIVAIYAVAHVAIGPGIGGGVDPTLLLIVAVFTAGLVATGSTVRTMQLRQGGPRVAELLGGRRVRPDTTDEAERRLINVVEEMAIASGTPVPAVFVLDHEPGINAFAAGYTLDDAAVAVTRGTLDTLNRDELQGVIAHEFSHILNGDMRLNVRLMGLLFGILLLAVVGRGLLHSGARAGRGRRNGGGGQIAVLGLALILVGYIGVFFGRLIQAAVSRQREYLADAAAVQYTRSPEGLAGALKKIAGASHGSRISDHHAAEAGHFFFANGVARSLSSLLATHPPLQERIRRVDPAWSSQVEPDDAAQVPPRAGADAALHAGFAATTERTGAAAVLPAPAAVTRDGLLGSVGAPQPENIAYAARLLGSLPVGVHAAAHEPEQAPTLLFALLVHGTGAARELQAQVLRDAGGEALWRDVQAMHETLTPLGAGARLPLLDLVMPALRSLSPTQQEQLRRTATALAAADQRTELFELALLHMVRRQLDEQADRSRGGNAAIATLSAEAGYVVSAAAWAGSSDAAAAADAFAAAAAALRPDLTRLVLRPRDEMTLSRLEAALERIRAGAPAARRRILDACIAAIAHDEIVRTREAELLRVIAEAIDCPMPPPAG